VNQSDLVNRSGRLIGWELAGDRLARGASSGTVPMMKKKKAAVPQYVCLALLFACAIAFQFRAAEYSFPQFFHRSDPAWPFTPEEKNGKIVGTFVTQLAKASGMREGDEILSVDGRPMIGTAVYGEEIAKARPGDTMTAEVRSLGESSPRTISLVLQKHVFQGPFLALASVVMLKIGFPLFSILLGFWVAAVRPRDPSAWCLLLVLLGLSSLYSAGTESWGPVVRDFAQGFHRAIDQLWPLFMLLFGIYFPEPFAKRGPAFWEWGKRILIPALILFAAMSVAISVGEIENLASVSFLEATMRHLSRVYFWIQVIATGSFFICIQAKYRGAASADAKRRLKLLYAGATVGMAPVFVMGVIANWKSKSLEQVFPEWIVLFGLLLMFLFPVTLAYVIVVQRALDVRVVIRQGLQYGLAKNGIVVLQIGITAVVLFIAFNFALNPSRSRIENIPFLAIGVTIVFLLQKAARRLRAWTDRRFFRDAYNAEQILAGLSDEVRMIVETRPLVERVANRIAESLHVLRVAVLLDEDGWYKPAYSLGYPGDVDSALPERAATVRRLKQEPEPARVYLDDENSWVNSSMVTEEERQGLATLDSRVLLPLAVKEKLLGIISLGEKKSEEPYSSSDLRLLKSVAAQTGLALANAQLTATIAEEVARREKMHREVEIAREVQERLFPQKLPEIPGLDYSGRCRTALGVGGDYYDFLALPDGQLGVALGDVSGKGIAAALMMASLQASLRAEAPRAGRDIGAMITRVNQMVFDASAEDRYATLFYAQYDPATRRLIYVNGGHCPPMLFRKKGGAVERLDAGGPVVGLMPECAYEQAEVTLEAGDALVIYTDGISEAMNIKLEEWGEQRLMHAVTASDGAHAEQKIQRIVKAADAFADGAPQHDDMTLVVMNALATEAPV
jgi:sigma-B regulation protein RsbU (phosphoserine phosphatase)